MCTSSSATSYTPPTIQQLIQKATSPTPQQASNTTLKNAQNSSDTPSQSQQDSLNTSGSRGTQVNATA
jgi:hypothetical protein